jgi:hypothetical protein
MRIVFLQTAACLAVLAAKAASPVAFDQSAFPAFTYGDIVLVEPRITAVTSSGVVVTDKDGKRSVVVPLDRALLYPELSSRAKGAIQALTPNPADHAAAARTATSSVSARAEGSETKVPAKKLKKTVRMQMEQAVWIAGLVHHRYDARDLSDSELVELHRKAQPILELQRLRGQVP